MVWFLYRKYDDETETEPSKWQTISMDQLKGEFCTRQKEVQKARQDHTKSTIKKWTVVLQNIGKHKLTSMFRIVSFVLSVPGINAFVERIIMVSFIFCNK